MTIFEPFDIIMTKWAGLFGTLLIAERKGEELKERLPGIIFKNLNTLSKYKEKTCDSALLKKYKIETPELFKEEMGEGGLYKALFSFKEKLNSGIEVYHERIPIRQETIEISELYDIDPYKLLSCGASLYRIKKSESINFLIDLSNNGIPSAVIGETKEGNDCIIRFRDRKAYIKPPKEDEIIKAIKDYKKG